MKVFISWSGERSKAVAEALRDWLQDIIQAVEPWISADIEKGQRWSQEIATQLEQAQVGIICMTQDNLSSRWLHYEAGALSKTPKSFVCTFLLDIGPTDFDGPLTQFQHTKAQKEDVKRLAETINRAQEQGALPDSRLDKAFERTWPELEIKLNNISASQEQLKVQRSEKEMIEEILETIRVLSQNSQSISRYISEPRLPSTLYWPPEDAQRIYDHYKYLRETARNHRGAQRLSTDEVYAEGVLHRLRSLDSAFEGIDDNSSTSKQSEEFSDEHPDS